MSSFSGAALASVALAAGVSLGTREARTSSPQPGSAQGPSQRTRPGTDIASVTCPALQVPRTLTLRLATVLDGKGQVEVHSYGR